MERLTEWDSTHTHGCWLNGKDCFTRLAQYEDLEEQGLLLRLPCHIGDIIYEPTNRNTINEYSNRN